MQILIHHWFPQGFPMGLYNGIFQFMSKTFCGKHMWVILACFVVQLKHIMLVSVCSLPENSNIFRKSDFVLYNVSYTHKKVSSNYVFSQTLFTSLIEKIHYKSHKKISWEPTNRSFFDVTFPTLNYECNSKCRWQMKSFPYIERSNPKPTDFG